MSTAFRLLGVLIVAAAIWSAGPTLMSAAATGSFQDRPIVIQAAGRGYPWVNFADARSYLCSRRTTMLRCKSFLISLLATFLIFGLSPTALAEPGSQIAGTYWMEVAPDGFPSLPGMLSLSDDGLVFAAQYMTPFTNNGRGNWEKVASRGVKGRFLEFGYFPDGSPGHILEVTFEGELDQAFATGELSFVINVYTADQNPLEEDPFFQNTGFMYLTRVPAD